MKKRETLKLTTAQFAKLHNVNRRTLHYYDNIELFSPAYKGDNGYRYYDYAQSMEFEFIRMLKELHLSIEEIRRFTAGLDEQEFLQMAAEKQKEIDEEIGKLRRIKKALIKKQEEALLCQRVKDMEIGIIECKEEYFLTVPYKFENDNYLDVLQYIQTVWKPEQYRAGVGSYISLEKVKKAQFEEYDGLFSPAYKKEKKILTKPKGRYLCGYLKGTWDRLPELYGKMLCYAKECGLELTGYAYEQGMNDFIIGKEENYVTQITIQIVE